MERIWRLPKIEVPRSKPHEVRSFRLPSCIGRPARPPEEGAAPADPAPAPPRREDTETWYRAGDALPDIGEIEPEPRSRAPYVAAALAASAVILLLVGTVLGN